MKNIVILFLLSFAIVSCQKESMKNREADTIKIVGEYQSFGSLKTTFTGGVVTWNAGDSIGLFSDLAETAPGVPATNVKYKAVSSGATSTFTSTTPVFYNGTAAVHSFSAIYPYRAFTPAATNAWETVPIHLDSIQTQTGTTTTHLDSMDYLIAKTKVTPVVGGTTPPLNLTFQHVFTALKFDITCPTNHTLTEIRLTTTSGRIISVNPGNTINIGQEPTLATDPYNLGDPAGGKFSIKLNASLPISTTPASAYMLIYPGNHAFADDFTISFKNENGTVYTTTKTGLFFNRGILYTVTIAIPNGGVGNAWE